MNKLFFLVTISFLLVTSCSDYLNESPSSSLPTNEAITSITDLHNALNGVYFFQTGGWVSDAGYEVRGIYSSDFTIFADLRGGDFEPKGTFNQVAPVGKYTVDASHTITQDMYKMFYFCIGKINSILTVIESVPVQPDEETEYKNLQGELYALRALFHFDLARLYARLPSTTDVNAAKSGIVIADRIFPADYQGPRSTIAATYQFVLDDINTALPLLSKDKTLGRINYWAVKGIQARALLYLEKNSEALAAAEEVINDSPYQLYSIDEYTTVWEKEGTNESMFEILNTENYNAQRNSLGYYTHGDGYQECGITKAFQTELENRTDDVRSQLMEYEDADKPAAYYAQKYPGRNNNRYVNNPKIIRLSEVYLIAAEAAFKSSQAGKADSYINSLRKNRIKNYTDISGVTLDDILTERRLELFVEGHNAWDYWRNKKSIVNSTVGEVKYDDYRTVLPIPTRELEIYPDLGQNNSY